MKKGGRGAAKTSGGAAAAAKREVLERLCAADRARAPWARPVLPLVAEDPARASLAPRFLRSTAVLERRGVWHGEWAEADPEALGARWAKGEPRDLEEFLGACVARWQRCEPVVLQGCFAEAVDAAADLLAGRDELRERLSQPAGLRAWVAEELADAVDDDPWTLAGRARSSADPERDIEKVRVAAAAAQGDSVDDLWLKCGWLSTHPDDASLRLRFSFGKEGDDDASRDIVRHRLVAQLAERLLPEAALVVDDPFLQELLRRATGGETLATQHIAYWNAPQGGALFHHDAFAEDALDGGAWRQLGVCYVQLAGRTAWIALSTEELCAAVRAFDRQLRGGAMPWVSRALHAAGGERRLAEILADDARLRAELALPGCGALHALVERGPEFTNLLAERGHAFLLEAGDGILLPNRGLESTCMHSVWCAGDEVAYSLSLALRPDRAAPHKDQKAVRRERRDERLAKARARRAAKKNRR